MCIIVSTSLCSRAMVLNQECVRIAWEAFSGTCLGFRWVFVAVQQTSGGARKSVCFESCLGDCDLQPQDELHSRNIIGSKCAPASSKMPIFFTLVTFILGICCISYCEFILSRFYALLLVSQLSYLLMSFIISYNVEL